MGLVSVIGLVVVLGPAWAAEASPNYEEHVQPILRAHCSTCHGQNSPKADLDVMTYAGLMRGSSSGAVVEAGDASASMLHAVVAHIEEPTMPPNGKIPDGEIEIIQRWIDGGLIERAGGMAKVSKKPKVDLTLSTPSVGRPEGPPALPEDVILEPFVRPIRPSAIRAMAASPWASVVALAGANQILLYHTDSLELVGILPFPEGGPYVLRFSRNGELLLAGGGRAGHSGKVVVFSTRSGERLFEIGDETDAVLAADISSDQAYVALGGSGKLVKVYSTATGELVHAIKKHTDWVVSLEFSPDAVLLASGDRSGGLHVWETVAGVEFYTLKAHTASVTDLTWRDDSNILASVSEDGSVRLWEMQQGKEVKNWKLPGNAGALSIDFGHDGRLATASRDRVVRIWDQAGKEERAFEALPDVALHALWTHDQQRLILADWTGQVRVANVADGTWIADLTTMPPTIGERLAALAESLQQAATARDQAKEKLQLAQAAMVQANEEVAKQRAMVQSATQAVESAKVGLSQAEAMRKLAADQVAEAVAEHGRLVAERSALTEAVAHAEQSVRQLTETKQIADQALETRKRHRNGLANSLASTRQALEKSKTLARLLSAAGMIEKHIQGLDEEIVRQQAELEGLNQSLTELTAGHAEGLAQLAASMSVVEEAEKTVVQAKANEEMAVAQLQTATEQLASMEKDLEAARTAAMPAEAALVTATEQSQQRSTEYEQAVSAVQAAEAKQRFWIAAETNLALYRAREERSQIETEHETMLAQAAEAKARHDAAAGRLAELEQTLSRLPARLEEAQQKIEAEKAAVNDRTQARDSARDATRGREALLAETTALSGRLKSAAEGAAAEAPLAASLGKVDELVALVTSELEQAKGREAAADQALAEQQSRLVAAEQGLVALATEVAGLPNRIEAAKDELAPLLAGWKAAEQAADTFAQKFQPVDARIAELTQRYGDLKSSLAAAPATPAPAATP